MMAKTAENADYAFSPKEVDPDKILLCLPNGWTASINNTPSNTHTFTEPHKRLQLAIQDNQATITEIEQGLETARIEIQNLRLVIAQTRSTSYCIGLYSLDGSYYLTKNRLESQFLPDYEITVWGGRDSRALPLWRDRLPFTHNQSGPRSRLSIVIPRLNPAPHEETTIPLLAQR